MASELEVGSLKAGASSTQTTISNAGTLTVNANSGAGALVVSNADGSADIVNVESGKFVIDSTGNALFNTSVTNPGNGNQNTGASILSTGRMHLSTTSSDHTVNRNSDGNLFEMRRSNAAVGSISVTTSATAYNTSSDYRLKENLTPLTGALDRLDQLPVYRFNFKSNPDTTVDGFVAHEVSAHVPEAVTGEKDAMRTVEIPAVLDEDGNEVEAARTEEQPDYQGIDQSKLVPLLVAAVKELKAKVEALEGGE